MDRVNEIEDIVNNIVSSPSFRSLISAACSNRQNNQNSMEHSPGPSSGTSTSSNPTRSTSYIQELRSLFPTYNSRQTPYRRTNKRTMKGNSNCSASHFYRDIILLSNPRAYTTLKGKAKVYAHECGRYLQ